MMSKNLLLIFLAAISVTEASTIHPSPRLAARQFGGGGGGRNGSNNNNNDNNDNSNNNNNNNDNGNGAGGGQQLCLNQDSVQSASSQTGQGGNNVAEGQVASQTDDANFINFCSGQTVTNGLQIQEGSCNGIVMGDIPSTTRMTSIVLLSPQHDDVIPENQDFDIELQTANLEAGSFTNPQETYYSAPQQLSGQGTIIGHVHVTVQDLGDSMNPQNPLDASQFAFFKGINDNGNGQGLLTASVEGGLPAGNYRVCTIAAAMNHQSVLMPVAQRGAQDDCSKFRVGN
ncbi:putative ribosomal protein s17 protein [Zalerion maritima]|uniref:Ribosomal protein s17 protein n=1 Tax=Zalerion maritima TaxID=339359 RepID=A0AAD5RRX6_9PEZI|nr:putative ribosomal protein s17 protein [Zalerion maritima]